MKLMSVCRAICAGSNWIHKVFAMVIGFKLVFLALHINIIHIPGRCEMLYINNTNFQMNTLL